MDLQRPIRQNLFMPAFCCLLLCAWTTAGAASADDGGQQRFVDRRHFVAQMRRVEAGMIETRVSSILGPPDSKEYENDSGETTWLYGVTPMSHFASLGGVTFDKWQRVVLKWGDVGSPPDTKVISEGELRHCLDILASLPDDGDIGPTPPHFDPLVFIRTVNELVPEGNDKVLASVKELERIANEADNLLLFLQIAFEPNGTGVLTLRSRWPFASPPYPVDEQRVPRFPLVLLGDVPLLQYRLDEDGASSSQDHKAADDFLEFIRSHCSLRKTPLQPTSDPLGLLPVFEHSPQWLWGETFNSWSARVQKIHTPWNVEGARLEIRAS